MLQGYKHVATITQWIHERKISDETTFYFFIFALEFTMICVVIATPSCVDDPLIANSLLRDVHP